MKKTDKFGQTLLSLTKYTKENITSYNIICMDRHIYSKLNL